MSFAWWPLVALWPIYFVLQRVLRRTQIAAPPLAMWVDAQVQFRAAKRNLWPLLIWTLLVVAAMRPITLSDQAVYERTGRDLQMAIDVSGSMDEPDFVINRQRVTRLEAVKAVAYDFISKRQGDRVGLIIFADHAYVHTPLSYDLKTAQQFLLEVESGLVGRSTAIGDAIALSVKRLRERPADSRVLVLLTDGSNTGGTIQPNEATALAKQTGVRIHTIGVGKASESLFMSTPGPDEDLLRLIANETGGQYFHAGDTRALLGVYDAINQIEPSLDPDQNAKRFVEWYWIPLLGAFGLLIWRRWR